MKTLGAPIAVLATFTLFFSCLLGLALEEVAGPSRSLVRQLWISFAAAAYLAGVLFEAGGEAGGRANFGLSGFAQWTNARGVHDLKNFAFQVGASASPTWLGGPSVGGDYIAGLGASGVTYQGGDITFGASLTFLFEAHALVTDLVGWDTDKGWAP
jgi:hypothetical protein